MEREEDVKVGANKFSERHPLGTAARSDSKDYKEPPPAPLFEPGELKSWSFYRAGIAEFVATFLFLYITVLTVMGVNRSPSKCSSVGIQGIAWAFGGMIFALVYCTAGISGGHINPAVTFGLFLARKLSLTRALFYIIMQCLGAICGAGVVKGFEGNARHEMYKGGANFVNHGYTKGDGLGAEIVGTFVLVYTVFSATDAKRNARDSHVPILAPLPIGFAVFLVHLATIPITGTGINPARSLGAAIIYNRDRAWDDHWIFWVGPFIGAALAAVYHQIVIRAIPFKELYSEELSSSIDEEDAESELLLPFLISLEERKQTDASKLVEEIKCLESDIEEAERRHGLRKCLVSSSLNDYSCQKEITTPLNANELKLMKNICHLESAYFSMRSKVQHSETDAMTHPDKDKEQHESKDALGTFFDGLCKYARYSKLEVRGILRNADFNNPANVICSLSFDRDEDYFASAGISKKIKIFEFSALCNDSVDIHYPAVEMSNKSKLSCVCWNNYIKNYLASTDYDGVVKLWDASTGQEFSQYTEHEKRAWSVDFSSVCPTKFASGIDDCTVKLWNISERNCLGTIKNVANVCCVQFSAHSSHLLAFGSADYSTYCYDLRNLRSPWCVLVGHRKAVSYVKFLDSETLVSASTDNTLKIWDLNKASPVGASASARSLTLSGHTNEKNFVGLSVADGYIACGSETNEVYTYYRSLPMPITSHKFGSVDPISGKETDDDHGQFVSSLCWRGKSDMLIAANSSGCVKVLQMV